MSNRFFIRFKGRVLGPMAQEKVMELVQRGQVTRHHELSPDGLQWRMADTFDEFYPKPPVEKPSKRATADAVTSDDHSRSGDTAGNQQHSPQPSDPWFAHIDGAQVGPVQGPTVTQWIALGKLTPETLVWKQGMNEWQPASLVQPGWFTSRGVDGSVVRHDHSNGQCSDAHFKAIVEESVSRNRWTYFVGVFWTISASAHLIVSVLLVIRMVAAPAASGGEAILDLLVSLVFLAASLLGLFVGIRIIHYASAITAMKHASSSSNLLGAARSLSKVWFYGGVYGLVIVSIFCLVFLIVYVFEIRLLHLLDK